MYFKTQSSTFRKKRKKKKAFSEIEFVSVLVKCFIKLSSKCIYYFKYPSQRWDSVSISQDMKIKKKKKNSNLTKPIIHLLSGTTGNTL